MKINLSDNCLGESTGEVTFQKIFPSISKRRKVVVDFSSVTQLDAAFLFHAFGKLYQDIPIIEVREKLIPMFHEGQKHLEYLYKNAMTYSESFFLDASFRHDASLFVQQNQNIN